MSGELLIIFFILLLAFILFTFLGRKSLFEGMENSSSTTYTSDNGKTIVVTTNSDGSKTFSFTNADGTTTTFTATSGSNSFTSSSGDIATLSVSGTVSILTITDSNGNTIAIFTAQVTTSTTDSSTSTSVDASTNSNANSNYNQYDNYNHYNQSSYPVIFYGPNGATARVIQTPNNDTIIITNKNGTTEIYYINGQGSNPNVKQYYGPNGGSATVVDMNGSKAVQITTPNGQKVYFYSNNNVYNDSIDSTINQYSADTNASGSDYSSAFTQNSWYGPMGGQVNTLTGPAGNTVATYDSSAYMNALPKGIPKAMIPPGEEDLYILKSEIVAPVCPKCPDPILKCPDADSIDTTKCPPCKPCGRCDPPPFECKKVPTYDAFNPQTMPVPVLSDFSQFGM